MGCNDTTISSIALTIYVIVRLLYSVSAETQNKTEIDRVPMRRMKGAMTWRNGGRQIVVGL